MGRIPVLLTLALVCGAVLLPAASASAGAEGMAIQKLNQIRRAHGLQALKSSGSLAGSSSRYARKIIRTDYFGHGARIEAAAKFSTKGETLAWHSGLSAQPAKTIGSWMNSPPHRAVLLSPRFRFVGMGMAQGRLNGQVATAWVAHVGTP